MDFNELELEVQRLINQAREAPQSLIPDLEATLRHFKGNYFRLPNTRVNVVTQEGAAAVREAIDYLRGVPPLPALREAQGLFRAARDHREDIGAAGRASHEGGDGSRVVERVERYGEWQSALGENIVFDDSAPLEVLLAMLVDDGRPSRSRRHNLFNPDFRVCGVAMGAHAAHAFVTVIVLAAEFNDNKEDSQDEAERSPNLNQNKSLSLNKNQSSSANQNDGQRASQNRGSKAKTGWNDDNSDGEDNARPQAANQEGNEEDEYVPAGAVGCKTKRFVKTTGNKRVTRVVKVYTLKDGSTETVEDISEEYL